MEKFKEKFKEVLKNKEIMKWAAIILFLLVVAILQLTGVFY